MADLKDMEGPIKFKKGVELYYDPKKDMFYDEKKKKYVKEKDIIKMVESSEDSTKTLNMEDDLNLSFSKMFDLYKEYQTKRIFEKIKSKKRVKKLNEKLKASDPIQKWISDFVDSDDERFEGKTKEERIEMAKGAYYGAQNEEVKKIVEGRDEEYEKFFQSALKKFGVDSPAELDDKKKKEFFDYVDKNWEGDNEEDEEESIEEKEFKPHMMYDPKTGKAYKAEKPEDHERMSKLGYTHEKPKKIEEETIEEYSMETKKKVHKAMMKKYGDDPYYKQVIDAILSKGTSDMEKAIKSLISIRGAQALKNLQSDMKSMLGETVEEKEETVSPKMAAYLNFLNKNLEEGKKDYEIYHNTFSSAIDEVKKFAKKNGYELDDDDLFHKVGTGPKKPSTGKTNKYHLKLIKGGKENKKLLHFQVYGMKSQYELNMYIS